MQLRFVRPHGYNVAGDVVEVPDGAAYADYLEPVAEQSAKDDGPKDDGRKPAAGKSTEEA